MFSGLRSSSPSPCPSPVRELVANLRCQKRDKYKNMIEPQEPIISKGRMTMKGGFADLRPRPYTFEKNDSLESNEGTPSISSSSRSDSCDSNDPIMDHVVNKPNRRFVKIPRKALKNVISHLSPRLSKKIMHEEKKYQTMAIQHPMWPNVMSTYARGVSTSPVQSLITPTEPSLTALKARAILDEKNRIRSALQMLADEAHHIQQTECQCASSCSSSSCESDQEDAGEQFECPHTQQENSVPYEPSEKITENLIQFQIYKADGVSNSDVFPMNPRISIDPIATSSFDTSSEEDFHDESIFDALDLDSVPTLSPEELTNKGVTEVRNVHLWREYIILETGPPTDSIFV